MFFVLALLLLPFILVAVTLHTASYQALDAAYQSTLVESASRVQSRLSLFLVTSEEGALLLASSVLSSVLVAGPGGDAVILAQPLSRLRAAYVAFADSGEFIGVGIKPDGTRAVMAVSDGDLVVYNTTGDARLPATKTTVAPNYVAADRQWFTDGIAADGVIFSDVYPTVWPDPGAAAITAAIAVRDASGAVQAVVGVDFLTADVERELVDAALPVAGLSSGAAFIVQRGAHNVSLSGNAIAATFRWGFSPAAGGRPYCLPSSPGFDCVAPVVGCGLPVGDAVMGAVVGAIVDTYGCSQPFLSVSGVVDAEDALGVAHRMPQWATVARADWLLVITVPKSSVHPSVTVPVAVTAGIVLALVVVIAVYMVTVVASVTDARFTAEQVAAANLRLKRQQLEEGTARNHAVATPRTLRNAARLQYLVVGVLVAVVVALSATYALWSPDDTPAVDTAFREMATALAASATENVVETLGLAKHLLGATVSVVSTGALGAVPVNPVTDADWAAVNRTEALLAGWLLASLATSPSPIRSIEFATSDGAYHAAAVVPTPDGITVAVRASDATTGGTLHTFATECGGFRVRGAPPIAFGAALNPLGTRWYAAAVANGTSWTSLSVVDDALEHNTRHLSLAAVVSAPWEGGGASGAVAVTLSLESLSDVTVGLQTQFDAATRGEVVFAEPPPPLDVVTGCGSPPPLSRRLRRTTLVSGDLESGAAAAPSVVFVQDGAWDAPNLVASVSPVLAVRDQDNAAGGGEVVRVSPRNASDPLTARVAQMVGNARLPYADVPAGVPSRQGVQQYPAFVGTVGAGVERVLLTAVRVVDTPTLDWLIVAGVREATLRLDLEQWLSLAFSATAGGVILLVLLLTVGLVGGHRVYAAWLARVSGAHVSTSFVKPPGGGRRASWAPNPIFRKAAAANPRPLRRRSAVGSAPRDKAVGAPAHVPTPTDDRACLVRTLGAPSVDPNDLLTAYGAVARLLACRPTGAPTSAGDPACRLPPSVVAHAGSRAAFVARGMVVDAMAGVPVLEQAVVRAQSFGRGRWGAALRVWHAVHASYAAGVVVVAATLAHQGLMFAEAGPLWLRDDDTWRLTRGLELPCLLVFGWRAASMVFWDSRLRGRRRPAAVLASVLVCAMAADWVVQMVTGYRTGPHALPSRFILPVTAVLRPALVCLLSPAVLAAMLSTFVTLVDSWRVLLLAVCLIVTIAVTGGSLLQEETIEEEPPLGRGFAEFRSSLVSALVFATTSENAGSVVFYSSRTEFLTLPYFALLSLSSIILLISLLVASFQRSYSAYMHRLNTDTARARRVSRRTGIIVAYMTLCAGQGGGGAHSASSPDAKLTPGETAAVPTGAPMDLPWRAVVGFVFRYMGASQLLRLDMCNAERATFRRQVQALAQDMACAMSPRDVARLAASVAATADAQQHLPPPMSRSCLSNFLRQVELLPSATNFHEVCRLARQPLPATDAMPSPPPLLGQLRAKDKRAAARFERWEAALRHVGQALVLLTAWCAACQNNALWRETLQPVSLVLFCGHLVEVGAKVAVLGPSQAFFMQPRDRPTAFNAPKEPYRHTTNKFEAFVVTAAALGLVATAATGRETHLWPFFTTLPVFRLFTVLVPIRRLVWGVVAVVPLHLFTLLWLVVAVFACAGCWAYGGVLSQDVQRIQDGVREFTYDTSARGTFDSFAEAVLTLYQAAFTGDTLGPLAGTIDATGDLTSTAVYYMAFVVLVGVLAVNVVIGIVIDSCLELDVAEQRAASWLRARRQYLAATAVAMWWRQTRLKRVTRVALRRSVPQHPL